MGKNKKSYAKILPAATVLFLIITGSLSALILDRQLTSIAGMQEKNLGNTLSLQLAKVAKNSIINQDTLSLQGEVDDILAIEGIKYVAVYNASDQILAKATKHLLAGHEGIPYSNPIVIENTIAGYASVQFHEEYFMGSFQALRMTLALLFSVVFFILVYLSAKIGKNFSLRLNRLIEQLPGDDKEPEDELSMLEYRLKPLIENREEGQQLDVEQTAENSALLAVDCKNLTILKTRVNPEHLESVMSQFDTLVDDAANIYGAVRLGASQRSIHLKFKGKSEEDKHPLRALYCATAIHALSVKLLDTQGIKLELASAISNGTYKKYRSQLLHESSSEEHLNSLQLMLEQAVDGEILLDAQTKEHGSLRGISLSPPSPKSLLYRVEGLDEASEKLVTQQLAILSRNI